MNLYIGNPEYTLTVISNKIWSIILNSDEFGKMTDEQYNEYFECFEEENVTKNNISILLNYIKDNSIAYNHTSNFLHIVINLNEEIYFSINGNLECVHNENDIVCIHIDNKLCDII